MRTLESYICGRWTAGMGKHQQLHDPTTGAAIAQCGTGGLDMDAVADHARYQGGPKLRELTFAQRGELLDAMAKALHAIREELIDLSVVNGGNTRKDAKFDVDGAIGTLAAYANWGRQLGDVRVLEDGAGDQLGRTARFWGQHVLLPREGVAVLVNAFNFPAWGIGEKAATALLAGMPVVVKPATATAMVAERVVRAVVEAKALPEGALQFLCGSAGDLLDHLGPQDVLSFTGSADTALLLRSKDNLLRQSVRVNVEADSLNAAVLGPDVTPASETWALFFRDVLTDMTQKAGQKCTAIRRILVPEDLADAVQEELRVRLEAVVVGNPADSEVRMGPLATASQLEDVRKGIERLESEADLVVGRNGPPERVVNADPRKGYFQAPVLLRCGRPADATAVHEHEVFGPAATLLPWDGTAAHAAGLVRRAQGCLVSSVYSDDRDFVRDMVLGTGAWNGRLYLGSAKMAEQALGPGAVLPASIHGGPGRAGGGEELGGLRGLRLYQQRCALQGDRAVLEKLFR